jgi:hypothetical protein
MGLILLGACEQPLSSEMKLRALVEHEKKMDVILQDLQMECDSSMENTLRYRADSLETALNTKPLLWPKAKKSPHGAETGFPHALHHAHQQTRHHHQHSQP